MIIPPRVLPKIRQVIRDLVTDTTLAGSGTYKRWLRERHDEDLGYMVTDYDEFAVDLAQSQHTVTSASMAGAEVQVGDMMLLIEWPQVPTGTSNKDRIVFAGQEYQVKHRQPVYEFCMIFTVEGGG